jgi:hypothetical protein
MKHYAIGALLLLTFLPSCKFVSMNVKGIDGGLAGGRITASANIITKTFEVGDFDSITSSLPCDINFTEGPKKIEVSAPDNVMGHISISAENGHLVLKSDGSRFTNLNKMKINLSTAMLRNMEINGAGDFTARDGITSDEFGIQVNGAGDINIKGLKADKVRVTIDGAGDTSIEGIDSRSVDVNVNGAGDCSLSGKSDEASVQVNGAGDIDISGLKAGKLDTAVHGAGKVKK